jgi:uncharacterized repeat protein (TIGR03833 family)
MLSLREIFLQTPIGGSIQTISNHPILKFKKNNSLNNTKLNKILKQKYNNTQITESKNHFRKNIKINQKVKIVTKENQNTNNYTVGKVQKILTNKSKHTRGIKVKLKSGEVGRIQQILEG